MEKDFQVVGTSLWIHIPSELDHHNAELIRREADRFLNTKTIRCVIFDFEQTNFMDSSGIGMMMGRYKNIRMLGGRAMAVRVNERIRRILTLSGVYKYLDILEGLPEESKVLWREE
jgi:stage II sporulation protein AA (anti-sigma F factor antagonist)